MNGRRCRRLLLAGAALALGAPALAEEGKNPSASVLRIQQHFKVDGIALFDSHEAHAARIRTCLASIFPGMRWCVATVQGDRREGGEEYKSTGYNIDGAGRVVYAISHRRNFPLKRDDFERVIHGVSEHFGSGPSLHALRRTADEGGEVNSLIAVWGDLRLIHLTEAEYKVVATGGSLQRGHLIDHRFDLPTSARARYPIYKLEGEAGFILHLKVTSADRADVTARIIYQPVFLAAAARSSISAHPLAQDFVRREAPADKEPRASEEEVERKLAAERRAREEARVREEAERKAQEERTRAEAQRRAANEIRQQDNIETRKAGEEEAKRAEEARRAREDAERKAAAERSEAERKAALERGETERRQAEEARRIEEELSRSARPARIPALAAERPDSWYRMAADAATKAGAVWSLNESQDRVAEERTLRTQSVFSGTDRVAVEVTFECTITGRERRLRASARGFDRSAGTSVAFRTEGEGTFGVRTRLRLDDRLPQDSLLFRDRQDDIASILEVPLTQNDLGEKTPRGEIWLRHYMAVIEFNLVAGKVTAAIAPYAENLRRVLDACAQ